MALFVGAGKHERMDTIMADRPLAKELAKFQELLPTLKGDEGKYALISGDTYLGAFESYADALKIGYEKFGLNPFLVKRIATVEVVGFITRDLGQACHT
jgi:hypothetical protein